MRVNRTEDRKDSKTSEKGVPDTRTSVLNETGYPVIVLLMFVFKVFTNVSSQETFRKDLGTRWYVSTGRRDMSLMFSLMYSSVYLSSPNLNVLLVPPRSVRSQGQLGGL